MATVLDIFIHYTYDRASAFVLTMPRWEACSSFNTLTRNLFGTTTLYPHRMHPDSTVNSNCFVRNGLNSSPSNCCIAPHCIGSMNFDRIGSRLVSFAIVLKLSLWLLFSRMKLNLRLVRLTRRMGCVINYPHCSWHPLCMKLYSRNKCPSLYTRGCHLRQTVCFTKNRQ